jgi:hypothetical protein
MALQLLQVEPSALLSHVMPLLLSEIYTELEITCGIYWQRKEGLQGCYALWTARPTCQGPVSRVMKYGRQRQQQAVLLPITHTAEMFCSGVVKWS